MQNSRSKVLSKWREQRSDHALYADGCCSPENPSTTTPGGGQDGDFRRARPAAVPDGLQAGEAEIAGVHRSEAHFLETRVVLDVGE